LDIASRARELPAHYLISGEPAFDRATGKLLGGRCFRFGLCTTPTYDIDGRQYVVIAAGGKGIPARPLVAASTSHMPCLNKVRQPISVHKPTFAIDASNKAKWGSKMTMKFDRSKFVQLFGALSAGLG
jgi:hypothetical protein